MEMAEQIDDSKFCTMNAEASIRIMGNMGIYGNSPDITIASSGLINSITWRPMLTLASDHLPIIILIEKPPYFIFVDNRNFVNFNKSNWIGFTEVTEITFTALPIPTDVIVGGCQFRKMIAATTARFIPAERIAEVRRYFLTEAVLENDPCDLRIRDLNFEIGQMVN
nr:uncharacterized protein LOC118681255 [Bactrocera oleae]